MTHDPAPREVERAVYRLTEQARKSSERHVQWTGLDRDAVHVLTTFVALVTRQASRYDSSPDA